MEIWADTAQTKEIESLQDYYHLTGITTNPAILSEINNPKATLNNLLAVQPGFLAVQVISQNALEMAEEAKFLTKINKRIIVKIPCTVAGYQAMRALGSLPVLATAVLEANQYALAIHFNCAYCAPYLGHVLPDSDALLDSMIGIQTRNQASTKIMGAAIKNPSMFLACIQRGINAITAPTDVLMSILNANSESLQKTQEMNAKFQSHHRSSSWKDC